MSNVIHVDFKRKSVNTKPADKRAEAYRLYAIATKLDEDPTTYEQAKVLYEQAIQLDPSFGDAWSNLGNVYQRQHDTSKARFMWAMAALQDPRSPVPWHNLGYVLLERQPEIAVLFFQMAITLEPKFADAHYNLAVSMEAIGARKLAKPHWLRFLELAPNSEHADIARQKIKDIPT